ncbi:NAD(P)-dependent oxidoreductase [Arthrobacter sp. TB 26]|uniref:NAD(P)-dependent oxidoreductase n=1 Tax=Arthrobacter sp. TB 26 TaxID=494420 RepID=UPI00042763C4|nr:NAD(P)-dependent oxidoreductase [Arthrobacter sp. TB 26]
MRVAVLGLGEAGSIYAADLARRGVDVTAADPAVPAVPAGVTPAGDAGEAARGADLVLSLVGGRAAGAVLEEALPAMAPAGIFADMNTASPAEKRRLANRAEQHGIPFVDVAILAPVPRARIGTPLVLSGAGADNLLAVLTGWGIPAAAVGNEAGVAAGLKLLRSVFMKSLATTILESVTAARAVGAEDWVIDQIASELGPSGHALVARILEGTPVHAVRREAEMCDARSFLETLGAPHPMTDGAIVWLQSLSRPDPG